MYCCLVYQTLVRQNDANHCRLFIALQAQQDCWSEAFLTGAFVTHDALLRSNIKCDYDVLNAQLMA